MLKNFDQKLRALFPCIHTYDCWFQVHKYWEVLPGSSFTEERIIRAIFNTNWVITWHLTIRLNSVLETV